MTQIITEHTARKAWRCATCDGTIEAGQAYRRIAFPPDNDVPRWLVYQAHLRPDLCTPASGDEDEDYPGYVLDGLAPLRRAPGEDEDEVPGEYVIGPEDQ